MIEPQINATINDVQKEKIQQTLNDYYTAMGKNVTPQSGAIPTVSGNVTAASMPATGTAANTVPAFTFSAPTSPYHTHGTTTAYNYQYQYGGTTSAPNVGQTTGVAPNFYQQYPPQYPMHPPSVPPFTPPMTADEREHAIEFIEELMFVISAMLDECDVPNRGGTMDRADGMPVEAILDLEDFEIILRPKRAS